MFSRLQRAPHSKETAAILNGRAKGGWGRPALPPCGFGCRNKAVRITCISSESRCEPFHLTVRLRWHEVQINGSKLFGFSVHVHMFRHACGYTFANDGHDTRLIQDYLGHKSIMSTGATPSSAPPSSKTYGGDAGSSFSGGKKPQGSTLGRVPEIRKKEVSRMKRMRNAKRYWNGETFPRKVREGRILAPK